MKFSLNADGAQSAGQGIGNIFKAFVLGPQVRQQAEDEAMMSASKMAQAQAMARKLSADAALTETQTRYQQNPMESAMLDIGLPTAMAPAFKQRLETGSFGPQYNPLPPDMEGPVLPAPADDETVAKLGRALSLMQRMYGTGSNVSQGADASLTEQKGRNIEAVIANPAIASAVGQAYAATDGKPLFNNVGTSGYSMNSFTGNQVEANPAIAKLFQRVEGALANQRNAAAGASSASAAQTRMENDILSKTGAKPGSGREAAEGALSSTILRSLLVPKVDEKNRPVRNPITGAIEETTDKEGLIGFYEWVSANNRKPTATAFAQWEAQGRPMGNKNPPAAPSQQTMPNQASASAVAKAREAIAKGAPRDKVIERLRQNGIDPTGL